MRSRHLISVLAVAVVAATSSTASALCRERIYWFEAWERNAWASSWGYITPDEEMQLNNQGRYVEFAVGCYRLPSAAPCNPVVPVSGGAAYVPGLMMSDFCPAYDCYTPSQEILMGGKYVSYEGAARLESPTVTTLAEDATLDSPLTSEQAVASISSAPVSEDVYVLEGDGGERLEVTGGHPMVLADGTMTAAKDLKEGDTLAGADGAVILLARVNTFKYEGMVWNVEPKSQKKAENIVTAQGFLAGSIRFQAQWGHEQFRLSVRDHVDAKELLAAE